MLILLYVNTRKINAIAFTYQRVLLTKENWACSKSICFLLLSFYLNTTCFIQSHYEKNQVSGQLLQRFLK
jgi:hypothetical protein